MAVVIAWARPKFAPEVLAKGMKEYNPDSSWQKTKEQEEMAADPKASGKK